MRPAQRTGVASRRRVEPTPEERAPMRKFVLSLAVLALVASPALAGKYNKAVSVGQKAPEISGLPAIEGQKDTSVSLGDIKDEVVVVVFLANHCPVVVAYEDRLIDFVNDYKGKPVKVVGVSVSTMPQDKLPGIKDYMKDKGSNYVYAYDESQDTGRAYGATNTPQFFVLDKDRVIRYMGAMDDNQNEGKVTKTYLRDAVDALLAGKEIAEANAETRPVGCNIGYAAKK
jgi:thiol-disulfide isomerase/thioredoxin